jgi:hypothetical protein
MALGSQLSGLPAGVLLTPLISQPKNSAAVSCSSAGQQPLAASEKRLIAASPTTAGSWVNRQPGRFLEQGRRNRVHGRKQPIDVIDMIAAPIPPHAVVVPPMKPFGRQGIHPNLIQLDGSGKTSEKISDIFWR